MQASCAGHCSHQCIALAHEAGAECPHLATSQAWWRPAEPGEPAAPVSEEQKAEAPSAPHQALAASGPPPACHARKCTTVSMVKGRHTGSFVWMASGSTSGKLPSSGHRPFSYAGKGCRSTVQANYSLGRTCCTCCMSAGRRYAGRPCCVGSPGLAAILKPAGLEHLITPKQCLPCLLSMRFLQTCSLHRLACIRKRLNRLGEHTCLALLRPPQILHLPGKLGALRARRWSSHARHLHAASAQVMQPNVSGHRCLVTHLLVRSTINTVAEALGIL